MPVEFVMQEFTNQVHNSHFKGRSEYLKKYSVNFNIYLQKRPPFPKGLNKVGN